MKALKPLLRKSESERPTRLRGFNTSLYTSREINSKMSLRDWL